MLTTKNTSGDFDKWCDFENQPLLENSTMTRNEEDDRKTYGRALLKR